MCDFKLHRQPTDQTLEFRDPRLLRRRARLRLEQFGCIRNELSFPVIHDLRTEVLLATDLGGGFGAAQHFEHDLRFEFRCKGAMLGPGRTPLASLYELSPVSNIGGPLHFLKEVLQRIFMKREKLII